MTLDATELRKLHELKPCPIEAQNLGFKCFGTEPPLPCCVAKRNAAEIPKSDAEPSYDFWGYPLSYCKPPSASGTDEALVERLRKVDSAASYSGEPTTNWYRNPEGLQAADRIEALHRELAASKAKLEAAEEMADALIAMIRGADDRVERAQTALEDWRKVNG